MTLYYRRRESREATQWDGVFNELIVKQDVIDSIRNEETCALCGYLMEQHGALVTAPNVVICPGDYITDEPNGFHVPIPKGRFEQLYETN